MLKTTYVGKVISVLYTEKHVARHLFCVYGFFTQHVGSILHVASYSSTLISLPDAIKCFQKQLYQEQIQKFKDKENEEMKRLEEELKRTRNKLRECEEHIKALTTELWRVGEKYLMQKGEADWLKKKQRSGSLMSLQHVHSVRIMVLLVKVCEKT